MLNIDCDKTCGNPKDFEKRFENGGIGLKSLEISGQPMAENVPERRHNQSMMNGVSVLPSILAILMFLFSMPSMTDNAGAWHAEVSIDDLEPDTSVNTIYVSDSITLTNQFAIVVENLGSQSMKISWMGMHFDWDPPLDTDMGGIWWGTGSWIGNEEIVLSGETYEHEWIYIDVPPGVSIGHHDVKVGLEVADPAEDSDWDSPTKSYFDFTVNVAAEPADDTPQPAEPPSTLLIVAVVVIAGIAIVAVVLAFSLRKANKGKP